VLIISPKTLEKAARHGMKGETPKKKPPRGGETPSEAQLHPRKESLCPKTLARDPKIVGLCVLNPPLNGVPKKKLHILRKF